FGRVEMAAVGVRGAVQQLRERQVQQRLHLLERPVVAQGRGAGRRRGGGAKRADCGHRHSLTDGLGTGGAVWKACPGLSTRSSCRRLTAGGGGWGRGSVRRAAWSAARPPAAAA